MNIPEQLHSFKTLIIDNQHAVHSENYKTLIRVVLITGLIVITAGFINVFIYKNQIMIPAYAAGSITSCTLFIFRKNRFIKSHPLIFAYILETIYILIGFYMSLIYKPDDTAGILVGMFCLIPILFIDIPLRIDIYVLFFCILHSIIVFIFKSQSTALSDTINCFSFSIAGIYVGNTVMFSRISEKNLLRKFDQDRITDILSGIGNRRSMFEQISLLETSNGEKPSGALMIDIDKFKNFNDQFGHAAGDECLRLLGKLMQNIEKTYLYRVIFYRYGGDEFAAFTYGFDHDSLEKLAKTLHEEAAKLIISGQQVHISIGAVYCGGQAPKNLEFLIESADKELYRAKDSGRNQICITDYASDVIPYSDTADN